MRRRIVLAGMGWVAPWLVLFTFLPTPVVRAQSDDPQTAAFNALRVASSVPVRGSLGAGCVRSLGFDVPATGGTPTQQALNFLASYGAILGQTGVGQTLVPRSVRNEGPVNVASFRQTYKGVPVFAGEISVWVATSTAGGPPRVKEAGGALLPDLALEGGLDTIATISPEACIAAAQTALGRPGAAPLADPKLMIFDRRLLGGAAGAHLVWAATFGDGDARQVLCDAHTGAIVFTRTFAAADLDLNLERQNYATLGDENGLNSVGQADSEAPTAWWEIRNVYNAYAYDFGWRGTQGNDNGLHVVLGGQGTTNGMFWYNTFGEHIELASGWTSFDVLGHEFTHGVIHHSSDLIYNNLSGALNEGYADAMGIYIDSQDWLLGEDRLGFPKSYVRDFQWPPNAGQPDKFSGLAGITNNPIEANDYGGVHYNSGILNKAHYLIATGAAFNGRPAFTNVALGRTKMGRLAFTVMRALPAGATFQDARAYSIGAASLLAQLNLYGFVPSDVCAVKDAFNAVEIGPGDFNCDGTDDNFQDPDGDFVPSPGDNCPNVWNPSQADATNDGVGDACDIDFDNDGKPDASDNCPSVKNWDQANNDGDAQGDACDPDDDNDGWTDGSDNCPFDYNPSQSDGNRNGRGDACDPDHDGDGVYTSGAPGDNCPEVYNPAQTDTDGDGMGDACDLCPTVADGAFQYGNPPTPYEPDSDEDGVPDACDVDGFGVDSLYLNGSPYNPTQMFQPNGSSTFGTVAGPAGSRFRIPVPVCDPTGDPDPSRVTEIVFQGLDPLVDVRLLDDDGLGLEAIRLGPPGEIITRGVRVSPDCSRKYFLEFSLGSGFDGFDSFFVYSSLVPAGSSNPWVTPGSGDPPPPPIADRDGDGLPDVIDFCPTVFDPTGVAPGPVVDVTLNPQPFPPGGGPAVQMLQWTGDPLVPSYDVVYGDLTTLRNTGGDFLQAVLGCRADNLTGTSVDTGPGPLPGHAFFFLVRGNDCVGAGTWNEGQPGPISMDRDPEINASPAACLP